MGVSANGWRYVVLAGVLCTLLAATTATLIGVGVADHVVLTPRFVSAGVRDAGIPRFVAVDITPSLVVRRLAEYYPTASEGVLDEAARLTSRVVTEEWVAVQTDRAVASVVAWIRGESEQIAVTIPVADRLRAAAADVRQRLHDSPLAIAFYQRLMGWGIDRVCAKQAALPFDITVDRAAWAEALMTAAPQGWVLDMLGRQLQQGVDFLTGDAERLSVTLPVQERQEGVSAAIRLLVAQSNVFGFLREHVVRPMIYVKLAGRELVPGARIKLDLDELVGVLDGVLDTDYVATRRADIVRVLADYVVGRTPRLELRIPLAPIKAQVAERLIALAIRKAREYVATQPPCTAAENAALLSGRGDPLGCRPPDIAVEAASKIAAAHCRTRIAAALDEYVPDEYVHTEERIKARVGPHAWKLVQRGREIMTRGATMDETFLRGLAAERGSDVLDSVLQVTRTGLHLTGQRVWTRLPRGQAAAEQARRVASTVRQLWIPAWLVFALVLAGLLLQPGLSWPTRLLLVGGALAGGALVVWLGGALAEARLLVRIAATGEGSPFPELGPNLLNEALRAIRHVAWLTVAAGGALGLAGLWWRLRQRSEQGVAGAGTEPEA